MTEPKPSPAQQEWRDLFSSHTRKRRNSEGRAKTADPRAAADKLTTSAPNVKPGTWTNLGNGARLGYWPAALTALNCPHLFNQLIDTVPWQQREVRVMGRLVMQPRLVSYMADGPHLAYTYSGLTLQPLPWAAPVQQIKQEVEKLAGATFNSCLLNYYRDGKDHLSWHSDNEALYGPQPTIASVSLGASRDFILRSIADSSVKIKLQLSQGDVLVMSGTMQQHWLHSVPKRKALSEPRVNLTFRSIVKPNPSKE
jgi:alkylated DNA repair dioxygenase AlkB